MALQASGAISLSQVQAEFGGTNPISVNEYYKDGANVPSIVETTGSVTATSYSASANIWYRPEAGGYPPRFNQDNEFYEHNFWTDQAYSSGTGTITSYMTLPVSGEYTVSLSGYNPGSVYRTCDIYLDNVLQTSLTNVGQSHTFTASAGTVLKLYSAMATTTNFFQHYVKVTTDNGNKTFDKTVNTNIPTSGVVSFADYYSGQKNYE